MTPEDEIRTGRARIIRSGRDASKIDPTRNPLPGSRVFSITGNVAGPMPGFFSGYPVEWVGTLECEGCDGHPSELSDGPKTQVLVLGPDRPSVGSFVEADLVQGFWVSGTGGGAGAPVDTVTLQSCFCPVPKRLRMTSADENCNYRMFQSCTLQYGQPPAVFAPLNITGPCFLSTQTFLDPITNSYFYYYLFCLFNQFILTRLYPTSPYSSPFRDATLYTWLIGGYGNVCSPFILGNGVKYPGSDASCYVSIEPA
jgi:hypothetical protein